MPDRAPVPSPSFTLVVRVPLLHPLPARPGDLIRVRPGHPRAPIAAWREVSDGWRRVAVAPANYGALLGPLVDGVVEPYSAADAVALVTAWAGLRAA